jgi:hypothetical protein
MQSRLPNAPDAGRDALIQALSEKFYIDEKGTHVSNGLSTDLIVFPSDREPRRKRHLDGMIDYAMSYATTFKDVDELNALYVLPKTKVEPDYYVALGLYLYFADECSRLRPDTTFLTELRKAGKRQLYDPGRLERSKPQRHERRLRKACPRHLHAAGTAGDESSHILCAWQ